MDCVYCGAKTRVTNSRQQKRQGSVWRRRQCTNCHGIFTTQESADFARSWAFAAKNGHLQPFIREQLLVSLYDSLRHRPTALEDATALTTTILAKLRQTTRAGAIPRAALVQTTLTTLRAFDHAAATHYQAFHPLPTTVE